MAELVLIAEDDMKIAGILEAYFTREGFRTVHARDGKVALELHRALKPDIVLADVSMPRLDGWEVLAEIQRRGHTPVIMVTALDKDVDRLQGCASGRMTTSSSRSIPSKLSHGQRRCCGARGSGRRAPSFGSAT